jgi:plasmid stabilization system protein ParE
VIEAIFTSAANRDVKRALDYYKRDAGVKVAENFIDQIEAKVAKILKNPESYRIVVKDFRVANLDRFPYQIVYRIASASTIRVLSVRHHKQHPDFGLDR